MLDWYDVLLPADTSTSNKAGGSVAGPAPIPAAQDDTGEVTDTTGNVSQWTGEFTDEHTRAAILRGGSYHQPQGSIWYFPQAYRNDQHGKLLLMAPSYDRAGTVGFRCAMDARADGE